jgi:hypothetical protein
VGGAGEQNRVGVHVGRARRRQRRKLAGDVDRAVDPVAQGRAFGRRPHHEHAHALLSRPLADCHLQIRHRAAAQRAQRHFTADAIADQEIQQSSAT